MNTNVYVATLPRSGSTLLGMMINQHSECFNMGESFFWGKFIPRQIKCSCGSIDCVILNKIFARVSMVPDIMNFSLTCQTLDELPEKHANIHLSNALKEDIESSCNGLDILSGYFREIIGQKIIIDTSTNIRIAEYLLSRPNWKIILLLRNPYGILHSCKKADIRYQIQKPLSRKVHVFVDFAEIALGMMLSKNVLVIKYEDLCDKPKDAISQICSFLQIPIEENMLNFKNDLGHTVMGNSMRFDDVTVIKKDIDWVTKLSTVEKDLIRSDIGLVQLYRHFGYELT